MSLVPVAVTRALARNQLLLQKNSPQILFGVGIIGVVGSTVLACRATLKMDDVLDEAGEKLHLANTLDHPDYSERDRQKDVQVIRVQTAVKIVRLYAPAIIIGGASIACLTKSHQILSSRNAGLTAAYAALEKGFAEYRSRVVSKYGEEEDRNLRYGTREIEIEEKGKKKKLVRVGPGDPSIYARFFDVSSASWNKDPEYNLVFLKCQQNYANDLLHARGHVFLNEVYDMLGIPRSKAGAVVGWLLGAGDDFVNFGIFDDTKNTRVRDFVNGFEGAILLDFNVDGIVYDRIEFEDSKGRLPWRQQES
jgi:hypothetical protein